MRPEVTRLTSGALVARKDTATATSEPAGKRDGCRPDRLHLYADEHPEYRMSTMRHVADEILSGALVPPT